VKKNDVEFEVTNIRGILIFSGCGHTTLHDCSEFGNFIAPENAL
jgi:hypothetical protein